MSINVIFLNLHILFLIFKCCTYSHFNWDVLFPGPGGRRMPDTTLLPVQAGYLKFLHETRTRMILMVQSKCINRKTISSTRWFKVTFSSPSWRSLNHLKGSLNHPKKVTKNCQIYNFFQTTSMKNLWDTPSIQALDHAGAWVPSGQAKMFLSGLFRASCQMPHVSPVSKYMWHVQDKNDPETLLGCGHVTFFEIFTQTNACSQI